MGLGLWVSMVSMWLSIWLSMAQYYGSVWLGGAWHEVAGGGWVHSIAPSRPLSGWWPSAWCGRRPFCAFMHPLCENCASLPSGYLFVRGWVAPSVAPSLFCCCFTQLSSNVFHLFASPTSHAFTILPHHTVIHSHPQSSTVIHIHPPSPASQYDPTVILDL